MDLIKIHERAKEADINIDIRFEPRFGGSITFTGRTIADDFYDTKCYSRMFNADEVNYLMVRGEDIIELAMDEIISNLRPEFKKKPEPEIDWDATRGYLEHLIFEKETLYGHRGLYVELLRSLKIRFDQGERTRELYDEIMALE